MDIASIQGGKEGLAAVNLGLMVSVGDSRSTSDIFTGKGQIAQHKAWHMGKGT